MHIVFPLFVCWKRRNTKPSFKVCSTPDVCANAIMQ
jgi:hypothetical protein